METNMIHNCDCLEGLRALPDNSADYVITSPPYNKAETANKGGIRSVNRLSDGYAGYHDNLPFSEYVQWQHELLRECWRILKPTGAIFYNHRPRPFEKQIQLPLLFNPGLPLRQVIIWHSNGGVNASEHHFLPAHEWILVLAGEEFKLRSRQASGRSDVWRIPSERHPDHPAPFPLALARRILASVPPGGLVLDPFMGSGTTAVAALHEGFEFIGFEQSAAYVQLANQRLEQFAAAPSLFSQ